MLFPGLAVIFIINFLTSLVSATSLAPPSTQTVENRYTAAHSLGDNYVFDPRDGWQTANVTNHQYKYRRGLRDEKPDDKNQKKSTTLSKAFSSLTETLKKALAGLKGQGKQDDAIITWYTGSDLLNPSCWSNGKWAPTDASFACALTMEGWKDRPKCFKFLEVCHTPQKCVFVRVVDTCEGCKPGSKHIDLTKRAFRELGELDDGQLPVKFRPATEPEAWSEKLWGPKA